MAVIHKRECLIDRTESDAIINYLDYLIRETERRRSKENGEVIDQEIADLNQCREEHLEHMQSVTNFLDDDKSKDKDEQLSYCLEPPETIVYNLVREVTGKTTASIRPCL